jgi:hypothetical protein
MKGVVGRPSNWTGAENVEGQADCQPPRRHLDAARETGLVERWFHLSQVRYPAWSVTRRRFASQHST